MTEPRLATGTSWCPVPPAKTETKMENGRFERRRRRRHRVGRGSAKPRVQHGMWRRCRAVMMIWAEASLDSLGPSLQERQHHWPRAMTTRSSPAQPTFAGSQWGARSNTTPDGQSSPPPGAHSSTSTPDYPGTSQAWGAAKIPRCNSPVICAVAVPGTHYIVRTHGCHPSPLVRLIIPFLRAASCSEILLEPLHKTSTQLSSSPRPTPLPTGVPLKPIVFVFPPAKRASTPAASWRQTTWSTRPSTRI